jgi:hypothetical protein
VSVFFAAGGEEDGSGEDEDDDGYDEERGSDAHDVWAPFRNRLSKVADSRKAGGWQMARRVARHLF